MKKHKHNVNYCKPSLTPAKIKGLLNKSIIGQNEAKTILSVAAYNHLQAIQHTRDYYFSPNYVEIEKSNVLLYGPTGVGKTALLKTLAQIINVPIAIIDSSSLTSAGYKGKNTLSILYDLYVAANGIISDAEDGIIFLDEFDKLSISPYGRSNEANPFCTEVQQELLKVFEGNKFSYEYEKQTINMDSSNILFICGGAFEGLDKVIQKRLGKTHKQQIGFSADAECDTAETSLNTDSSTTKILTEDFINYGFMRELIGRLPILCPFRNLSEKDLVKILASSDKAITKQLETRFAWENNKLTFHKDALRAIAHEAIKRGTGARGLRSIVEQVLYPTMFELPERQKPTEVIVTAECITKGTRPKLITL